MKLIVFIAFFLITITASACSNSKVTNLPIVTVTSAPTETVTHGPTATVTNVSAEPFTIDSKWVYFDEDGSGKYYIDYIGKKVINGNNEKTDDRVFVNDKYLYFCSFTKINKISKDGNGLFNLCSRPESGADMYITKIEEGWIYFEVISEDGISKDRIKLNGDGYEHIGQEYIDE